MHETLQPGDTIKVTTSPNEYFHKNEELHVKEVRPLGAVVHKACTDIVLFSQYYVKQEKQWKGIRCPLCQSMLFEAEADRFVPFSVRVKCRKCKEMIIVRGKTSVHEVKVSADASLPL